MSVLLLLALLPFAAATQVSVRVVPCPLGEGQAKVYERVAAGPSGGYDSDLATYATGGQWRAWRVSSCDPSLFSLYGTDMGTPVPEKDRERLSAVLRDAVAKLPDARDPAVWDRYAIAAALYAAMGRSHLFLGDLWLEASWTARDEAVGFYPGLEGPAAARALVEGGKKELQKPLSDADRQSVLFNLARVAHRGGFVADRDAFLARLGAEKLDAAAQKKVATFRRIVTEVEPRLQDAALAELRAALAGELTPAERARVTYLVADLLRRRGRAREAVPLYQQVSKDEAATETVRAMATFLAEDAARSP